jgi:hypothetical protein
MLAPHQGEVKFAVTARLVVIVTVQVPVPLQSPDQPLNEYPEAGVAVIVIGVVLYP